MISEPLFFSSGGRADVIVLTQEGSKPDAIVRNPRLSDLRYTNHPVKDHVSLYIRMEEFIYCSAWSVIPDISSGQGEFVEL